MGRIRTIKPEFCSSKDTGALSRDARLFFLQLLTEADDAGRLLWLPRKLCGVLYPHDEDVTPAQLAGWADECIARSMLVRYAVDSVEYVAVVNWSKHQRVDHAAKSRLPDPPTTLANSSRDPRENLAPGTGNREQGKGTGKEADTGSPDVDPPRPTAIADAKAERLRQVTQEAIDAYNAILGKPNGLLPAVHLLTPARLKQVNRCVPTMRQICQQAYGSTTITAEAWTDYFRTVSSDPFRSGRQRGGRGHENWTPDFDYLTRPDVIAAVFDRAMSDGDAGAEAAA